MPFHILKRCAVFGLVAAIAVCSGGCSRTTGDGRPEPVAATSGEDEAVADHGGWWCVEHGVPEEECSVCSRKAAAGFKAEGDWCEEHNRAESQCFICDPSRADKFVALYKAKVGEEPPKPTD